MVREGFNQEATTESGLEGCGGSFPSAQGASIPGRGRSLRKAEGGAWTGLPHWLWQVHREAGFLCHVEVVEHQRPCVFCKNP